METESEQPVESKTIQIPWASWARFVLFVLSWLVPAVGLSLIIRFWRADNLHLLFANENPEVYLENIQIIPWLIIQYWAITLPFITLCFWVKKGKMKPWDEGLIMGLIIGLIFGLIGGVIGGLIMGLIMGLKEEFSN